MNPFEGLLQDNSFPFYVLFIEIDPKQESPKIIEEFIGSGGNN